VDCHTAIDSSIFYFCSWTLRFSSWLKRSYQDAAPVSLIGASNHFEVAIAKVVILFGLSSGAALAAVVRGID
jgi:ACR3 family arsenite transporter